MKECNSVKNPMVPGQQPSKDEQGVKVDETQYKSLIGSLIYITATRPGMLYSVSLLCT